MSIDNVMQFPVKSKGKKRKRKRNPLLPSFFSTNDRNTKFDAVIRGADGIDGNIKGPTFFWRAKPTTRPAQKNPLRFSDGNGRLPKKWANENIPRASLVERGDDGRPIIISHGADFNFPMAAHLGRPASPLLFALLFLLLHLLLLLLLLLLFRRRRRRRRRRRLLWLCREEQKVRRKFKPIH